MRYPFYRKLGGSQGLSGRAENLAPPGFDPRTVQPLVSHCMYYVVNYLLKYRRRGEVRTQHFGLPYIISALFVPRFPSEHQTVLELYRKRPLTLKDLGLLNISFRLPTHPLFLSRQRKTIILFESLPRDLPNFKFYVAFLSPSGEYQKYLEVTNHRSLPFNLISLNIYSLAVLEPEVTLSPAVNYAPSNKGM